jgi:hypothetical protein
MKIKIEVNSLLARWIRELAEDAEMPAETAIVRALASFFNDANSVGDGRGACAAVDRLHHVFYLDYMGTATVEEQK